MSTQMDDAYCRHCRQVIHYDPATRLWFHGIRRRECNPPFYRPVPRGAHPFALPSHRHP